MANLGRRKHVLLCEIKWDHGENFRRYPKGNVERVHEILCVNEGIFNPFLVDPGLNAR